MNYKIILVIIIVGSIFLFPFFQQGYFKTDDGEWAIIRLSEMKRELRDGQIPARWSSVLNHGYGYPLFLFTYPLPYYIGSLISFSGMGLTNTIKILFILGSLSGALGMYVLSRKYWGDIGGLVSSIFYITAPYKLVNLYIRGSVGEIIALGIVPWLFYFVSQIGKNKYAGHISSILIAFLILTHNISALLFLPMVIIYFLVNNYRKKELTEGVKILALGFFLSAFFWFPLLLEKHYIFAGNNLIADRNLHFATFRDVFLQNFIYSVKPPIFIGYLHVLILFISLLMLFVKRRLKERPTVIFFLIISFLSICMMFSISSPIWNFPIISMIDFPWRLMLIIAFTSSFLAGIVVNITHGRLISVALCLAAIVLYFQFVQVGERFIRDDNYYEANDATTTSNDELMPVWVVEKPTNMSPDKIILNGVVNSTEYTSRSINISVTSYDDQEAVVNMIYFPGWEFFVNNQEVRETITDPGGLIAFNIPKGSLNITGMFLRTTPRLIGDLISLLGLGFLVILMFKTNKIKT